MQNRNSLHKMKFSIMLTQHCDFAVPIAIFTDFNFERFNTLPHVVKA